MLAERNLSLYLKSLTWELCIENYHYISKLMRRPVVLARFKYLNIETQMDYWDILRSQVT